MKTKGGDLLTEFSHLTYKCIKGLPIDEVKTRTLREIGFPVDAPEQPNYLHSPLLSSYFSKLYDTPYSIVHTVEKLYIRQLLQTGSREAAFNRVLNTLAEYGITTDELIIGLTSGCVFSFSSENAQTMLDEFYFIVKTLLPRQLSDLYYSFDIEPNPAHGVFFDIASEELELQRYTDRRKNNYGQFVSHTQDGVKKRILSGETFQSIYQSTCATKTIINEVFSDISRSECEDHDQDRDYKRLENALFRLSKLYRYMPTENGFTVYMQDKAMLEVFYLSEQCYRSNPDYDAQIDRLCSSATDIPRIVIDYAEGYISSVVRDAIQVPDCISGYHERRSNYFKFGTAEDDCFYNWDAVQSASLCGCFGCEAIFKPSEIVEWNDGEDACCPHCGRTMVITDSQGYKITEEFLHNLRIYAGEVDDDEE